MDAFPGQPARYSTDPAADGDNRSARRRSQAKRWAVEVGFAAVLGGLALVDPNRLTPGKRAVYRLSEAAVAAAMIGWSMRGSGWPARAMTPGFAAGAAGLSLGLAELSERLDARIVGALDRRGVSNPRAVIAAVTVGTQLLSALSPAQDDSADDDADFDGMPQPIKPLPAHITHIVAALLAADDSVDGGAISTQLETALAVFDEDGADASSWIAFEIAEDVPLSPLSSYTHPARLRLDHDGRTLVVTIRVDEGRLESVSLGEDWNSVSTEDAPSDAGASTLEETHHGSASFGWFAHAPLAAHIRNSDGEEVPSPTWSELDLDRAQIVIGHGEGERRQDYRARS